MIGRTLSTATVVLSLLTAGPAVGQSSMVALKEVNSWLCGFFSGADPADAVRSFPGVSGDGFQDVIAKDDGTWRTYVTKNVDQANRAGMYLVQTCYVTRSRLDCALSNAITIGFGKNYEFFRSSGDAYNYLATLNELERTEEGGRGQMSDGDGSVSISVPDRTMRISWRDSDAAPRIGLRDFFCSKPQTQVVSRQQSGDCEDVYQILGEASSGFQGLRGQYLPQTSEYASTLWLPGASECTISVDGGFQCRWDFEYQDPQADAEFSLMSSNLRSCANLVSRGQRAISERSLIEVFAIRNGQAEAKINRHHHTSGGTSLFFEVEGLN